MNINIKNILIFTAGVCVGAFSATIFIKKEYEAIVQEEVASVREMGARKNPQFDSDEEPRDNKIRVRREDKYKKIVKIYRGDSANSEDEKYHEYEKMSHAANHYQTDKGPYEITTEQFCEEMNHFDKLTYHYYEGDDTLIDDNEEIIADVASIINDDVLAAFKDNGLGVVYVRNENQSADYEIICVCSCWSES